MSSKRTGQTIATPGSALDTGDFVEYRGVWYRLDALEDSTRYSRRFLGVDKNGGHRRLLLDSQIVKAYRWNRT